MLHPTVIVNVRLAPTPRLALEQVTVPDANVEPEEAETNVAPEGSVSVTRTFVASSWSEPRRDARTGLRGAAATAPGGDGFPEECLSGRDTAVRAQHEVNRSALPIDGALEAKPFAPNLHVRLVDPP